MDDDAGHGGLPPSTASQEGLRMMILLTGVEHSTKKDETNKR